MRLKTPTVDIAPVKLYPYVKSKTQTHVFEFASCFCPYRLYPYDTLCTYGAKQFDIEAFLSTRLKLNPNEVYDVYEVDAEGA